LPTVLLPLCLLPGGRGRFLFLDHPRVGGGVMRGEQGADGDEGGVRGHEVGNAVDLGASAQGAPGTFSKESCGRTLAIRFASLGFGKSKCGSEPLNGRDPSE
jgi:hypothetical protein